MLRGRLEDFLDWEPPQSRQHSTRLLLTCHRLCSESLPLHVIGLFHPVSGGCLHKCHHDWHQALSEFVELVGGPPGGIASLDYLKTRVR
jgi:hypothetical protein